MAANSGSSCARPPAPWPPARRRCSTAATLCSAAALSRLPTDLLVPVEVPVQLLRPGRFRPGFDVEVHHGDDPRIGRCCQGTGVMRMLASIEEYQVPRIRPDDGTLPLYIRHIGRVRVVRERQFAAG